MATILNPTYRTRLGYQAALLGGMCYLMSMLLIGGNSATQEQIAQHELMDKLKEHAKNKDKESRIVMPPLKS